MLKVFVACSYLLLSLVYQATADYVYPNGGMWMPGGNGLGLTVGVNQFTWDCNGAQVYNPVYCYTNVANLEWYCWDIQSTAFYSSEWYTRNRIEGAYITYPYTSTNDVSDPFNGGTVHWGHYDGTMCYGMPTDWCVITFGWMTDPIYNGNNTVSNGFNYTLAGNTNIKAQRLPKRKFRTLTIMVAKCGCRVNQSGNATTSSQK